MNNSKQGSRFEDMVLEELHKFLPDMVIQRIQRYNKYESNYDIEITDHPELIVDCKSTIHQFTFNDLRKLLKTTKKKYCSLEQTPVVIFGERRGKTRINRDNIGVALLQPEGVVVLPLNTFCTLLEEGNFQNALLLTPYRVQGNRI